MRLQPIIDAIMTQVRPVPGFPGYRVWTHGRVESCWDPSTPPKPHMTDHWRPLKPNPGPKGHLYVRLTREGKQTRHHIARLVLQAFVGDPEPGMQARHFNDPNPGNNNLSNLRWGTAQDNSSDAVRHGTSRARGRKGEANGRAVLTEDTVVLIMSLRILEGLSVERICARLSLPKSNQGAVECVIKGRTWNRVTGLPPCEYPSVVRRRKGC